MSVLIKGMEMPKNDEMKKIIIGRAPNGIDPIAIVTGDNTKFYKIIDVPTPHGRLIDDFKLLRALIKAFPNQSMNFYDTLERVIDEAPTIIEAEESK